MLDYNSLRNIFKGTATLNSEHLVLAEWNMNKYQTISQYGVYIPQAPLTTSYDSNDGDISSGENYLIYDDGSTQKDSNQEYFSQLSSIFKPRRPDPGIILMQKFNNTLVVKNASVLRRSNINPSQPRYYPFSEHRKYDYFNSAKTLITTSGFTLRGAVSTPSTGVIAGANPFVVYEDTFPCNKITIKVQNHISVPAEFSIEILQGSTWVTAYNKNQSSSADFANGKLNIYYNPSTGTWVKVSENTDIGTYVVDDLNQLSSGTPTELKLIKGIRLSVYKMALVSTTSGITGGGQLNIFKSAALEIIEMSPRLEVNLSDYTERFSFDSKLGDSTNFGLPVGSLVSTSGNISLSNENGAFLFSGKLSELNMLSPDVKFMFYQIVNDGVSDKAIPLKVLFSTQWNVSQDYSATIELEDGFKFLREASAPDLLIHSNIGQPLSIVILFLLDNAGITGYQFKKTSDTADIEDTLIRSFFCKKEQTVGEVLQELAIATQCSVYFDAIGKLTVLTKEKLTEKVGKTDSASTTPGTDFWMIFDENYTYGPGNASEYSYTASYTSNVLSYSENRINPITDGDITYHTYGPPKIARLDEFPEKTLNKLIEGTTSPASLAFANFGYNTQISWNAAEGQDGAMGAANLIQNIPSTRLKNIFTGNYTALDENEAVRNIYNNATNTQRAAMIVNLDANEGLTIGPYEGTILIGTEFLKYKGKLFRISSPPTSNALNIKIDSYKILFSNEEFLQEIRNIGTGGSIHFIGLVIDFVFRVFGQTDDKYIYKVIDDGRAKLGSTAQTHYAFIEGMDGIDRNLRYGIRFGATLNPRFPVPSVRVKYNFLERTRYKSVYRQLSKNKNSANLLDAATLQSYLGFLKLDAPLSAGAAERSLINDLYTNDPNTTKIAEELNRINKQTDGSVPDDGPKSSTNFDDFVFFDGERNIYGQKFNLNFKPNIINVRMRLYSPRRSNANGVKTAQTLSSIAGVGFGINQRGEGYYLEVEGVGSGKDSVAKKAFSQNLRFYKVEINKDGQYQPYLIFTAPVSAYIVENIDVQIIKSDQNVDPFFDLTIIIDKPKNSNNNRYTIRYGDTRIGTFTEENSSGIDPSVVSLFVRGDSMAIFEYISAASRPIDSGDISLYRAYNRIDEKVKAGILPLNQQNYYIDGTIKYYFNDFAKLVREVKDFDIRFNNPVYTSKLMDISKTSGQYMIKKYNPTAFGAKLIVINTSPGPILLTQDSNNPLYIVSVPMEELSSGILNMDNTLDSIDEKRRNIVDREKNKSIYGSQAFNIDSQYMQTLSQARDLMRWIIRYCSRPRIQLNMEIFANPLLELGDKVKVYDKKRGYLEDNPRFGNKTFTISSINYSVDQNGPSMSVEIVEVGQ